MPAIAAESFNATIRHQVLIERFKAGEIREVVSFLREIDEAVRIRLSGDAVTSFQRARLEALLADVGIQVETILNRYTQSLRDDLFAFSASESRFEALSLTNAVDNDRFEATIPAPAQVSAAITAAPLSVRGASGGKLLDAFLTDYTTAQKNAITGAIRRGAFEGQTNQQIITTIRGTRALRHTDGILNTSRRQAEAAVRTAVQHVSSVARLQTYQANADLVKQYEWVSTLDNRTTAICQSLSGQRFKLGEGPLPPAHVNCRSTTVPVLDERFAFLQEGATRASVFGPVDADETYFSWLQKQNAAFQNAAIGPTRAKLLRDGGLSAERFAQLGLSRNFEPLTLAEMQRLEPLAFTKAGIKLNPGTGRVIN